VGENEVGAEAQGPPRADTIMVLHASVASFRKLSIPRDSYAEIEGCGPQKINAAFSCNGDEDGNAALMIRTVESFLGIELDHVVIVDFDGFVDFIDALGGVEVDLEKKVCGQIGGGKKEGGQGIRLDEGEHDLRALQALALARLRVNECDPSEDDTDRAARQQVILNGIKGRLTSPTRAPINFIKGPIIGWTAPRAFVSDMGGLTLPQVAISAIFGGGSGTNVLEPAAPGPGSSLIISQSECERAVEKLTGSAPERTPACSPGG
jgi:LCP family protein required for cell wall assembly